MKRGLFSINKNNIVKAFFAFAILYCGVAKAQLTPSFVNSAVSTGNNCYTITNNTQSNSGAAWYDNPIDLTNDFDIVFTAYFGANSFGADGMAFILKSTADAVIGGVGGGLGYKDLPNQPSLAVEFDTYSNSGPVIGDPSYSHIAVHKAGNISHFSTDNLVPPVQASASSTNIKDNQNHEVKIKWRAETQTFTVIFDCSQRINYTADIVNTVFQGNPIVYFGFTGSTGEASNKQSICFQYLSFLNSTEAEYSVCQGGTVNIDADYTGAVSYQWTPAAGVSDPTISNPVFSPTESTVYTVAITDNCGEVIEKSYTVNVANPTADVNVNSASVCSGSDGEFVFTGTPDTEVSYTLNGGVVETILLDNSGLALLTLEDITANQVVELVSISFLQDPFCVTVLSGTSVIEVQSEDAAFSMTPDCDGATATILGTQGGTFSFNPIPQDNAVIDMSTGTIINGTPGASYTVQYVTNGSCSSFSTVVVTLYPEITYNAPQPLVKCDMGNGSALFDLNSASQQIIGSHSDIYVSFYETEAEAAGGLTENQLPLQFTNTIADSQVIWVRIESEVTGCFVVTDLELDVVETTPLSTPQNIQLCDDNTDGIMTFDLTQIESQIAQDNTGLSFSYAFQDGSSIVPINNPEVFNNTIAKLQNIIVNVENDQGCIWSSDFNIIVNNCFIQRGISPNNDGLNDYFDLTGYDVQELSIFNRYGRKVYSQEQYTNGWYGQADNDNDLPDGTYYYSIIFSNPIPEYGSNRTGWIYINREE